MKKNDVDTAADNAVKLFKWLERRMTVTEGIDMMIMALAITITRLAAHQPKTNVDEVTEAICDVIKGTVTALQKMPADERA